MTDDNWDNDGYGEFDDSEDDDNEEEQGLFLNIYMPQNRLQEGLRDAQTAQKQFGVPKHF